MSPDRLAPDTITPSPELEPVRQKLAAAVLEQGAPSLAVAVAREGKILWAEGFGWADRARRVPADAHTPYSLASISKPITATGLMALVEKGKVDLDRPVEEYLSGGRINGRAGAAEDATVRRVAQHRAGLPLHYHFFYEDEEAERPHMAETLRRYGTLVTAPEERMNYSNLGYGILDHLIAQVSGVSYGEFLRREVFNPLGMTRSSIDLDPAIAHESATRYGGDGVPYPFYDFDHPGGSAVFSSAYDLLRFAMACMGTPADDQCQILSEASLEAMFKPVDGPEAGSGYGIGWGTQADEAGYLTRGHTGGMGGVATIMAIVPTEQIAVVALANASSMLPFTARSQILGALLPKFAHNQLEQLQVAMDKAKADKEKAPAEKTLPQEALDQLVGKWEGTIETYEKPLPVKLEVNADGLMTAQLGEQLRTLVDKATWAGGRLVGAMHGDLGTADARRRPGYVMLDIGPRDGGLDGAAVAMSANPDGEGGAPEKRVGNALSHWIRLERATE